MVAAVVQQSSCARKKELGYGRGFEQNIRRMKESKVLLQIKRRWLNEWNGKKFEKRLINNGYVNGFNIQVR